MSRSYKKHGIIKDKGLSRGKYNRRFRRVNRQRVKEGKDPKLMFEITNPYDVCDFQLYWDRDYFNQLLNEGLFKDHELEKTRRLYFMK